MRHIIQINTMSYPAKIIPENIGDVGEITQALQLISLGGLVEIRIPKAGKFQTVSGYFTDATIAEREVRQWDGKVPGIYFTLNPIAPELLGRAANRLITYAKSTTSDQEVLRRTWLPIDIDPMRASGISSSDAEHQSAIEKAFRVQQFLIALGWPKPIVADSGNGAHLLFRVELPNDNTSLELCKGVLEAIALRFDDSSSSIDQTVGNASRIWKLYGTMACKGDELPERPHRQAHLLDIPDQIEPVSRELLDALAGPLASEPIALSPLKIGTAFDVTDWLDKNKIKVTRHGPWNTGEKWVLEVCPFNSAHNDSAAVIVQFANGATAFRCHHNGCVGKSWHDLRQLKDPTYQKRQNGYTITTVQSEWSVLNLPSNKLSDVAQFEDELLPDVFRDYVLDIADRLQCPPDFSAAAAITFAGGVLGRRIGIRPKRRDDWLVVPNLWGAAIGRPGVMKTPAIAQVQTFLNRLEIEARGHFQKAKVDHERNDEIGALESKTIRKMAEDLIKKGSREEAERKLQELPRGQASPTRSRYIVNDTTVEKLGELLSENPHGLVLIRDELVGFLKSLEKTGNETQRAFMLEAWNGDGRFTYDRIIRETVEIEAACVSIFGGIQPGPFADYLRSAVDAGSGDDGLIQRFQLVVWPDISSDWRNVDRWPNTEAKERMWQAFRFLSSVDGSIGQRDEYDSSGITFLRFTNEAQELFDEWREKLERTVRAGNHHPAFESHLSKYRSLIPSLALICHLVDAETGPVGTKSLIRALAWAEYLESHARRIYAIGANPSRSAAIELVNHIRRGALTNPFQLRDVYRNNWKGLGSPEMAEAAVSVLDDHGCLRSVFSQETGGRPGMVYFIHPELLGGKA
jgi:hypothetical protein